MSIFRPFLPLFLCAATVAMPLPGFARPADVVQPAGDSSTPSAVTPFTRLGENAWSSFRGTGGWLQVSAVSASWLLVESGADTVVHNYFVRHTGFSRWSTVGVYAGYLVPLTLGGVLLVKGWFGRSPRSLVVGSAVLQATLLATAFSSLLKGVTGRPAPSPCFHPDGRESEVFRFGLLRGGIHYGWPSGHMMTNTAAVTAFLTVSRPRSAVYAAGGLYLGFLFLSVVAHEKASMHWFSDAVAGTLMGFAVGTAVGRGFRALRQGGAERRPKWSLSWHILPGGFSLSLGRALTR